MGCNTPASLSFNISPSLLRLVCIESVKLSNHFILCHPLLFLPSIFPSIRVFSMNWLFTSGGKSIGASAPASILPINIEGWFPLGLTGSISLLSKDSQKSSTTHFESIDFWRSGFFMVHARCHYLHFLNVKF